MPKASPRWPLAPVRSPAQWNRSRCRRYRLTPAPPAAVEAHRVLAFAPPDARPYFAEAVRGRFELTAQTDGDLGRRMAAFFQEQLAAGADRVVLVGTDSPTLPLARIEQAFAELEH